MASALAVSIVASQARSLDRVLEVFRRYRREEILPAMQSLDAFFESQSALTFCTSLAEALLAHHEETKRRRLDTERMKLQPTTFKYLSIVTFALIVLLVVGSVITALLVSSGKVAPEADYDVFPNLPWYKRWPLLVLLAGWYLIKAICYKGAEVVRESRPHHVAFGCAYALLVATIFMFVCLEMSKGANEVVDKEATAETLHDLKEFEPALKLLSYKDGPDDRKLRGNELLYFVYKTRVDEHVELDRETKCTRYCNEYPERCMTMSDTVRDKKIGCTCACEFGEALHGGSSCSLAVPTPAPTKTNATSSCRPAPTPAYENLQWVVTYVYDRLPALTARLERMDVNAQRKLFFASHAKLVRALSQHDTAKNVPQSASPSELDELAHRVVRVLSPPFVVFPNLRLRSGGGAACSSTESGAGGDGGASCVRAESADGRRDAEALASANDATLAAMRSSKLVNAVAYEASAATPKEAVTIVRRARATNVITVHVTVADSTDVDRSAGGSFVALRTDDPQARIETALLIPYSKIRKWVLDGDLVQRAPGSVSSAELGAVTVTIVGGVEDADQQQQPYTCSSAMLTPLMSAHKSGGEKDPVRTVRVSLKIAAFVKELGGAVARAATLNRLRTALAKSAAQEVLPYVEAQLLSADTFLNYEVALRAKAALPRNDRTGQLGDAYVAALKGAADEVAARRKAASDSKGGGGGGGGKGDVKTGDPYKPKRDVVSFEEFRRRLGSTQVRDFFAEGDGIYWLIAKLGIGSHQLQLYYDKLSTEHVSRATSIETYRIFTAGCISGAVLVLLHLLTHEFLTTKFQKQSSHGGAAGTPPHLPNSISAPVGPPLAAAPAAPAAPAAAVTPATPPSSPPAVPAGPPPDVLAQAAALKDKMDAAEANLRKARFALRAAQGAALSNGTDVDVAFGKRVADALKALDESKNDYLRYVNSNIVLGGGAPDDDDDEWCEGSAGGRANGAKGLDTQKIMWYAVAASVLIAGSSFFVSYIETQGHILSYNSHVMDGNTRTVRASFEIAYNVLYNARFPLLGLRPPRPPDGGMGGGALEPPIGEEDDVARRLGGPGGNDTRRLAVDAVGDEQLRALYDALVRGVHALDRCNAIARMAHVATPFPTSKIIVQLVLLLACVAAVVLIVGKMNVIEVVQRMRRLTALRHKAESYGHIDERDYCYVKGYTVFDPEVVSWARLAATAAALGVGVFLAVEFSTAVDYYKDGLYFTDAFAARSCMEST